MRARVLVLAVAAATALAACSSGPSAGGATSASASAFIPRTMLEITPCITDALARTFGAPPETDHSYKRAINAGPEHYVLRYVVRPNPGATGVAEDAGQRIVYEVFNKGRAGTGVKYTVEVRSGSTAEWLAQAAIPLEQCGAIPEKR